MSITRTQLRQLTARETRLSVYRTGTADSGGTTTSLLDGPLKSVLDSQLVGAWVYFTSGAVISQQRLITTNTGSTGICTWTQPLSAAPDGVTYEILPFRPSSMNDALIDVIRELSQERNLERRSVIRGIVSGSPAYNADFDYWPVSTAPDGYEVTAGSVTKDTTRPYISVHNMRAAASTDVEVTEGYYRYFTDFRGGELRMYCWVRTTTADANIGLDVDGVETLSPNHSGGGEWERLECVVNSISADAKVIQPKFHSGASEASFADWWVEGGERVYEHPWVYDMYPHGPDDIKISAVDESNTNQPHVMQRRLKKNVAVPFNYSVEEGGTTRAWLTLNTSQGRRLQITASSPLTVPNTDDAIVEVTRQQSVILVKRAAMRLLEDLRFKVPRSLQADIEARIATLSQQALRLEDLDDTIDHSAILPWGW